MNRKENTSSIINFPLNEVKYSNTIVVFIDLQNEYISSGRAYAISEYETCLKNCQLLLNKARECGLTIVHFRTLLDGAFFNPQTEFSHWINDFTPKSNEMVFERAKPSIFSNENFKKFIKHISEPNLILAGFTGERGCLATAIEASQNNTRITYVQDASTSSALGNFNEEDSHKYITKLMNLYSKVSGTVQILTNINSITELRQEII